MTARDLLPTGFGRTEERVQLMKESSGKLTALVAFLSLTAVISLSFAVAVDQYLLTTKKVSGRLLNSECESSGFIYVDYGLYEHFIKTTDGTYKRQKVPKSLCDVPRVNDEIEYHVGKLTSTVVAAKLASGRTWEVLQWYHWILISLMVVGYAAFRREAMPPIKVITFVVVFVMFRFLIASL